MANSGYQEIQVECYSGFKTDERPVAFICEGKRREIIEIINRWYEDGLDSSKPVTNYFKVKSADVGVHLLRYDSDSDSWSIRL